MSYRCPDLAPLHTYGARAVLQAIKAGPPPRVCSAVPIALMPLVNHEVHGINGVWILCARGLCPRF